MSFRIRTPILLIPLIILPWLLPAQKAVKVNLVSAGSMLYNKQAGADLRRLIGDVVFEHEGAYLTCDSAYFYEEQNNIEAFGNIRIRVSDTLNIFGDHLLYDGNLRAARITGKVRMVDRQTTLLTDRLLYDRNTEIASYVSGGTITGNENKLSSRKGYYFTARKEFFFRDSVVLINPRYTIRSDTLLYHTVSRIAFFYGPTRITSRENFIYCENGWYNTISDIARFSKHAFIRNKGQLLRGDSLYYEHAGGYGQAMRNVSVTDSVRNIIIHGQQGTYRRTEGYSQVTDSLLARIISDKDTLYLHADTLHATFDMAGNTKTLSAYRHVKYYRNDIQGMCDSLHYAMTDSSMAMHGSPVLWSDENQLTADSIRLWMRNKQPDSMMLYNTAMIISLADTGKFNQIKGRDMTGYFSGNELIRVSVNGNAKTIYHAREDDGSPIGVNVAASSDMIIFLSEKQIQRIKYLSKPDAILYPETNLPPEERVLPGFIWMETRRPLSSRDTFRW